MTIEHGNGATTRLTIAIAGYGARGETYANLAEGTGRARVVAVADPRAVQRSLAIQNHGPELRTFASWQDLASAGRIADIVVISVQDREHLRAMEALAPLGYHVLLEKPLAPTEEECRRVAEVARRSTGIAAVCHVLRYTPYTKALQELLRNGAIGEVVGIDHLEPIGFDHYAHSFVRGNWANAAASAPILLTKSVHDIDWLAALVGAQVTKVNSVGRLNHFTSEHAPKGATARCVDCPVEATCVFSAARFYRTGLREGGTKGYFTKVMAPTMTAEAVEEALAEGPYGRCVYQADNDVCDQQSVLLEYANGVTATFTLSAFTPLEHRRTRVFGTRGQITGDGRHLDVYDFFSERRTVIDTAVDGASAAEGHGGGDRGLVETFLRAVDTGDLGQLSGTIDDALDAHLTIFEAERSRTGTRSAIPA